MTGELMHTTSKERNGIVYPSYINCQVHALIIFVENLCKIILSVRHMDLVNIYSALKLL